MRLGRQPYDAMQVQPRAIYFQASFAQQHELKLAHRRRSALRSRGGRGLRAPAADPGPRPSSASALGSGGAAVHQPTGARRWLLNIRKVRACANQGANSGADALAISWVLHRLGQQEHGGGPAQKGPLVHNTTT